MGEEKNKKSMPEIVIEYAIKINKKIKEHQFRQLCLKSMIECFRLGEIYKKYGEVEVYPTVVRIGILDNGVEIVMDLPRGFDPKKVEEKKFVFEQGFGQNIELKRVSASTFILYVMAVNPFKETIIYDYEKIYSEISKYILPIVIGSTARGNKLIYDMVTEPNLLVAGEPGSGKSITLIEILTTLVLNKTPEELQLYLFDLKQAAFYVFKNLPHVRENTHDRKKIKKCFEDLLKELNFRSDLLEKYEVPHINRLPKDVRPPYIIVGIDEFSLLDDNYSTTAIQNIAAIGRALGVYVILSTQRPDSKIVDGRIKALLTVRIGGRMQDVYNSRIIIDDAGCENLTTPGHMKAKTMNGITDVKVFLLEEDEALRLLEPYRIKKEVVIEENKEEAEAPKKSAKKVSSRKIKTSKVIDWRGAFK